MRKIGGVYKADKGKMIVVTPHGAEHCVQFKNYRKAGDVVEYATLWMLENIYVTEVIDPKWKTDLVGYEVVYYHKGHRLSCGNPEIYPTLRHAENVRDNWMAFPWRRDEKAVIEEVRYEGIAYPEVTKYYNGKEVVDNEHYVGLDAYKVGDYFADEQVDEFRDVLPPKYNTKNILQMCEPVTMREDETTGKCKDTYETFKRIADGVWEYCGDCFYRETVKHGNELKYV